MLEHKSPSDTTTDQLQREREGEERERERGMASSSVVGKRSGVVWLMFAWFLITNAAVYKVGDSAGWTTIGNVDYKRWSSTKTFQLGDIIGNEIL